MESLVTLGWTLERTTTLSGAAKNDELGTRSYKEQLRFLIHFCALSLPFLQTSRWSGKLILTCRVMRKSTGWSQVSVICGTWFMWVAHSSGGKSQVCGGCTDWKRQLHVYLGWLLVVAVAVQAGAGLYKYYQHVRHSAKVSKWHGAVG
jgi:hypothetical protein